MRTASVLALVSVAAVALAWAPGAGAGNGADGSTYVLTSFDGTSLLGLNDQGRTFDAQTSTETNFRQAQLDRYIPTDPVRAACREAAADYNQALTDVTGDGGDGALQGALSSLASTRCKARVVLYPIDPLLPPNPIRIRLFQPVP